MPENKYLWEGVPAGVPCWHIHHGTLLEESYEPLEKRANYIRAAKPPLEVERRLRLMRPVQGQLPEEVAKAARQECKAAKAYSRTPFSCGPKYSFWLGAHNRLHEARDKHATEIAALHKAECPNCPWDGNTIFPRMEVT